MHETVQALATFHCVRGHKKMRRMADLREASWNKNGHFMFLEKFLSIEKWIGLRERNRKPL